MYEKLKKKSSKFICSLIIVLLNIFFIANIIQSEKSLQLEFEIESQGADAADVSLVFFELGNDQVGICNSTKTSRGVRFDINEEWFTYNLCAITWNNADSDFSILSMSKYVDAIFSEKVDMSAVSEYITYIENANINVDSSYVKIIPTSVSGGLRFNEEFIAQIADNSLGEILAVLLKTFGLIAAECLLFILARFFIKKCKIESLFSMLNQKVHVILSSKEVTKSLVWFKRNGLWLLLVLLDAIMIVNIIKSSKYIKSEIEVCNDDKVTTELPIDDGKRNILLPEEALSIGSLRLYFEFEDADEIENIINIIVYENDQIIVEHELDINELVAGQATVIPIPDSKSNDNFSFRIVSNGITSVSLTADREGNVKYGIQYQKYDGTLIGILVLLNILYVALINLSVVKKLPVMLHNGIMFFVALAAPVEALECMVGNLTFKPWSYGGLNLFIAFFIFLIIFCLVPKRKNAFIIYNIIMFVYATISYFILQIRGIPLLPQDINSIGVATTVASNYTFKTEIYYYLGISIFVFSLLCIYKYITNDKKDKRVVIGGVLAIFCLLLASDIPLNISTVGVNAWSQATGYKQYGHIASFYANVMANRIDKPRDYNREDVMQRLAEDDDTINNNDTDKPNIIIVMNEAFSDLRCISDFETNEEVLSNFKRLSEKGISGNLYVSIVGGNTCNTEFEFLTGNSLAFLPPNSVAFQNYIDQSMYSVAGDLKNNGYKTVALHPYFGGGWNRTNVYPLLGIDEFLDINSFTSDVEYVRSYISDKANYEKIIEIVENEEEPLFMFNVTMQNHGGYELEYRNFKESVELVEDGFDQTEQYLSLIKLSDASFSDFWSQIEASDEKTIVCLFGDHQPFVEKDFINSLYGKEENELSLNELQQRYCVPYLILANYDISQEQFGDISANYLGIKLLEVAGIETNQYFEYLSQMYEKYPVINVNGYKDSVGNWFLWDEEEMSFEFSQYAKMQYGIIFDGVYEEIINE